MQYVMDVVPWPSLALVSLAAALLIGAWWAARRSQRQRGSDVEPYATWDDFLRDVLDSEVPVDRILERCGGKLPQRPPSKCSVCGAGGADVRHTAPRAWTHCVDCSTSCPVCQEAEIRTRIDAEHHRMSVGSEGCPFCRQMLRGGR